MYITYGLAKNSEYFQKLTNKVSHYSNINELQSIELKKLPILNAVIHEVLRLYPPIPSPMGSVTPIDGLTLSGYYIPGGVS